MIDELRANLNHVLRGKEGVVELVLACLLARGHLLIEDLPGLGKTTLAKALARGVGGVFARIQCTPDLLPTDITGFNVLNPRTREFEFVEGPVFSDVLLADEINRATPRTQSALFEAMAERQVTNDKVCRALPSNFFVVATQNPFDSQGVYPLPEAQLDRFMMKVLAKYPEESGEVEVLRVHQGGFRVDDLDRFGLQSVGGEAELLAAQEEIRGRTIRDELLGYIACVVRATRDNLKVEVGASPRAGLMLLTAAKAFAALQGRLHVVPDDIKAVAKPVLRHRLLLKPGAEVDGFTPDDVLDEVLGRVEIPR